MRTYWAFWIRPVLTIVVFFSFFPAASAADFQLKSAAKVQKQISANWGQFNEHNGQAIYSNTEEDTGVYYIWSVPTTIAASGTRFEMSAENRKGKGYAEAAMSVEVNYDARLEGDLSRIQFKADPGQTTRQSRSGTIIPPAKVDEFTVIVRLGAVVGEDADIAYTYSRTAAGPVVQGPAPTISADVSTPVGELKSSDPIAGTLKVSLANLPDNKGEIELTGFLTTYTAADAIEDFGSNYMAYLTKNDGGPYTHERVKYRTTDYRRVFVHNGLNEFKLEDVLPMNVPRGIDEGEYLLIVFVSIKGTKIFTTGRAGVDLANVPKRILLSAPAVLTPTEGFQGAHFYLDLKFQVEGLRRSMPPDIRLRVRGNITGPEQIGVPEKAMPLVVSRLVDEGGGFYSYTDEISLQTEGIRDPGDYVWHYTVYASEGFAPYEGEVRFKVKPGVEGAGGPQEVTPGEIRIDGIGVDTLEINTGSGWRALKNGEAIPVGRFPDGVQLRSGSTEPVLKFPDGRKIKLSESTELILRGDKGEAALSRGSVKVFGPDGKVNRVHVTTPSVDVEEVGTVFSVIYDEKTGATVVGVEQGEVLVTPKNPKLQPVRLKAGNQAKFGDRVEVTPGRASDVTGFIDRVAPEVGASRSQAPTSLDAAAIAGVYRWDWSTSGEPTDHGATCTINLDGTVNSSYGHQGRWRIEGGRVHIDWSHGPTNDLQPTGDPKVLEGWNQTSGGVRAIKQVTYDFGRNPVAASNLPGVWRWDWNKAGEPVDQGATVTFNTDGTMTSSYAGYYGTWKVDGEKVVLVWTNVGTTNTLYSTNDPNVLEGWGQFAERIRATKKESFASQNSSYEYGIDRPGWDYTHFPLSAPNPDLCASRCQQENRCRAWTYVKPGYQGPDPMCWLKNFVPPQVKGADFAVSGVVRP